MERNNHVLDHTKLPELLPNLNLWLCKKNYELNTMTCAQFIEWKNYRRSCDALDNDIKPLALTRDICEELGGEVSLLEYDLIMYMYKSNIWT